MQAILFDIDGTLLDTTELLYQAFEYAIKSQNLKPSSRKEMSKVIGVSLEKCYLAFAPSGDNQLLCKTHNEFQIKNPYLSKLFPKTTETLKKLKRKGIKLAGITNRWKRTAEVSIKRSKLNQYLEFVNYRDGFMNIKPNPDMLHDAIKKLGVSKDEVILVGDTAVDIKAAKDAGIKSVGATYGFLGKDIFKEKPDFLINELSELPDLLS